MIAVPVTVVAPPDTPVASGLGLATVRPAEMNTEGGIVATAGLAFASVTVRRPQGPPLTT